MCPLPPMASDAIQQVGCECSRGTATNPSPDVFDLCRQGCTTLPFGKPRRLASINTGWALPLQLFRNQRLKHFQPDGLVQTGTAASSSASRLERAQLRRVRTAGSVWSPKRTGGPSSPADVLGVVAHIIDEVSQHRLTTSVIGTAKLRNECFETVFLFSQCQW